MYIQEKITRFDMEFTIKEKKIATMDALRSEIELSKEQITDVICEKQIVHLKEEYGNNVKLLTLWETVNELEAVTETELRKRKKRGRGEGPRFFQKIENSKIYYPLKEVACEMYLEEHPVFYSELSLSKIIKSRHG